MRHLAGNVCEKLREKKWQKKVGEKKPNNKQLNKREKEEGTRARTNIPPKGIDG